MFELKKLSPEAVDAARQKAAQYRLLNHPFLAESICRDILAVKPDDQDTLVILCLTLCDQFGVEGGATVKTALEVAQQFQGEYERSYLVFRATVESSFQRESGVAGFLESQGEFIRSVDVMQRLLRL